MTQEEEAPYRRVYHPLDRLIALGFIFVIVIGNLWLVNALFGVEIPGWMLNSFEFTLVGLAILAVLRCALYLLKSSSGSDEDANGL